MLKRLLPILALPLLMLGCDVNTSDRTQQQQQETILAEGTAQVGMPAIHNFAERRMLKLILELRDQPKLLTYTYTYSEVTGKFRFLGNTLGYGLPYATEFTSPQKDILNSGAGSHMAMPQADPNGLFSPSSAEGTWVLMVDPNDSSNVQPVYVEPRVLVSRFKLPDAVVDGKNAQ